MTPKGADLEATDLIEVSTIESGSYVTRSITGQELIDAIPLPPTGLTIGTTPISSGTIGRVLFQGTGNVLQQSSSLFWDSTNNRLGIGTSSPSTTLHVVGQATISTALSISGGFVMTEAGNVHNFTAPATNRTIRFITNSQSFSLFSTGNFAINTTTDAGFRLDVNGTARISPTLTINGTAGAAPILQLNANGFNSNNQYFVFRASNADKFQFGYTQGGASNRLFIYNPLFANDALRIMEATNNVGINTTTDAGFRLDVNGTARFSDKIFFGRANFSSNDTDGQLRLVANAVVYNSAGAASTSTTSSCFEITSTTKGFLPPRMTTTQKNAIASPAAGLVVYDTTLAKLCVYTTTWETITSL
jgi:hypothetical protein